MKYIRFTCFITLMLMTAAEWSLLSTSCRVSVSHDHDLSITVTNVRRFSYLNFTKS